ncbi:hypothetical protein [Bradyrhizobium sp. B117]|uniref:hypothetical protein n=1 Tax=Bradyrhizobium sp. B117 TaxID=3140246 RepID=UPI0031844BC2
MCDLSCQHFHFLSDDGETSTAARAASIVAFSASKLVYRALPAINWITLPIRSAEVVKLTNR